MKKIKILIAVLLSLCLAFAVTGCSGDNLKDSVINGFNDMLQHFSKYALTDEKDLQGDKTKGEDTYTGSYTADYPFITRSSGYKASITSIRARSCSATCGYRMGIVRVPLAVLGVVM